MQVLPNFVLFCHALHLLHIANQLGLTWGSNVTIGPTPDLDVEVEYEDPGQFSNKSTLERQIYFSEDHGKGWSVPEIHKGWLSPGVQKGWRQSGPRKGWAPPPPTVGWYPPKKPVGKGLKVPVPGKETPVIFSQNRPNTQVSVVRVVLCDVQDKCHNFAHCASYHHDLLRSRDRCCLKNRDVKGMCCSAKYPIDDGSSSIGDHFRPYDRGVVTVPEISTESISAAARFGADYGPKYKDLEIQLIELNIVVKKGTPAYGHLLFFQTTPEILAIAQDNFLVLKAGMYIQEKYYLVPREAGIGLQEYSFTTTVLADTCPPTPECNEDAQYRTHDGSCNNLNSPRLGQMSTPLIRLLPPDYADGIWSPRRRRDGGELPNPRLISRSLIPDFNQPDPRYSHLVMQHGQFVDHDLAHVPTFRLGDFSGISCCQDATHRHPACFEIGIPPGDSEIKSDCMNFVRSMVAPRIQCDFGHADQLNQLTHWLDCSQVYGNNNDQSEKLRAFTGGFLRVTRDPRGRHLLPLDLLEENDCGNPSGPDLHCFVAGDKRVNEQIGLTNIHTVWLREHNRIAAGLSVVNPHWNDEKLYHEARRILIAEYQHITHNEWLPIIIGRNYMEVYGILPLYQGHTHSYNPAIDGSVSNSFTAAAFRMGHTLVQGYLNLQNEAGGLVGRLTLRDFFNNPHLLREPGILDFMIKGLLTQPIQMFDNFVTTELRDHLFQTGTGGMDLIALNIQRGRDHGLPSYNEYRDLCRLGRARDFEDLQPIISAGKAAQLETIYENVDDIDLFIGGLHETPLPGALLGPTFVCIIGDQFVRSQKADRFFYSHGGMSHSFTEDQLHSIRSTSMARIICDNSDGLESSQPLAFHLPNPSFNPMLPCRSPSIPGIDLSLWRE